MASISVSNTFSNGTTADASQINTNFTDIINGTSDGTKDFSISALTVGGTLTANGNVNLGNASGDDLSITASLASSLAIKTTATYNVGSSTLGLLSVYLGNSTFTTRILSGASSSWSLTLPATAGTSRYRLETDGAGATSWHPVRRASIDSHNISIAASVAASALTITLKSADATSLSATNPADIVFRSSTATTGTAITRSVTSDLTLVVSSGSTLGCASAVAHYLYIYALDNSGTVELAISQSLFSDYSLVSTTAEGGAGAADSNATMYSTTARSNVPCRLIARISSTQATAGTWATTPAEQSLVNFSIGANETVACRYGNSTTAIGTTAAVVIQPTKQFDTHNFYNPSTGVATIPAAGLYRVTAALYAGTAVSSTQANRGSSVLIYKNGASNSYPCLFVYQVASVAIQLYMSGSTLIQCAAGDTLEMYAERESQISAYSCLGNSALNYLIIERI
jgi:hypothetical protein